MEAKLLLKVAQEVIAKRTPPKRPDSTMVAYPDYSKSLVTQRKRDPQTAGIERGLGTGVTGAVLGALIARIVSERPSVVAGGAAVGGLAGGAAGYQSGKHEAESDYSKTLFLRRRMGINEPGELDALLKHPGLAGQMIEKTSMVKKALSPTAKAILGVIGGGAAGWGLGTEGMSRIMGYHDDPGAKHMGGAINAANLAVIGGILGHGGGPALARMAREHMAMPASMVGMELLPSAKQSLTEISNASRENAANQVAPSLNRAVSSPAGQGVGVGVTAAGLASLITGLRRARTDKEITTDTSRAGMVGKDFAKFVVPAAIGGGVVGSMIKRRQP